jgi:heptosyltransferase II
MEPKTEKDSGISDVKPSPRRILILQTAFLGDAILSTPFIRGMRRVFPGAVTDILVIPENKPLFRADPNVDSVLTLDKRSRLFKWPDFCRLVLEIRRSKYDLAFSLQRSMTSSLIMVLGGVPERIGLFGQRLLTRTVKPEKGMHIRDRYLALLRPFNGGRNCGRDTAIHWTVADEKTADRLVAGLPEGVPKAGISPGSKWNTKRWPEEYYLELIKILEKTGVVLFLIGGKEDDGLCRSLLLKSGSAAVNTCGRLSIPESAALISRLDLMITNDSAPLHIADAVDTPVFAIFGPTVRRFGCFPYRGHDRVFEADLYCRPCGRHGGRRCPEGHFRCMRDLRPERIASAAIEYLEETQK